MMRVAFFDRDGTISEDYPDAEWTNIKNPVLMPGSIETLKYLYDMGYQIIIITNQYIIGEGYITTEQYERYNEKLLKILNDRGISILDVFHCPHARYENCNCCKPKTGMIQKATEKYPQINLSKSFVVGDSVCDIQMAENLNMTTYGINVNYSYKKLTNVENLKELLKILRETL